MLSNTRLDGKLKVSSVIAQSYSRYIGIEVTIPSGSNIPSALFNYMRSLVSASSELPNLAGIMLDTTGDLNNRSLLIQDILQIFSDRRQVDGKKRHYKYL
jgi:hypothetical protein